MAISDWPIQERPREKLLARGPASLSDAELLAIFLRTGVNGTNAVTLSSQLLEAFCGLRGLLEASRQAFCAHRGLGEAKYAQLQAVLEMARRHLACELQRGIALENPELVRRFLQLQLRHEQREVFVALMLDSQHRVISCEELFSGTIDGAAVYPREVVKAALGQNAAAVIFAHNHPSGIAEPSQADKRITERLVEALALVDIRVLDHLIVGDQTTLSFAETGLMPGPY